MCQKVLSGTPESKDKINWIPNFTDKCDKYFMTFGLRKVINIRLHTQKKRTCHLIDNSVKLETGFKKNKLFNALNSCKHAPDL